MDFESIVRWHLAKYPLMTAQDLVKLAYQSARGSEHMLPDRAHVADYLIREISQTPQTGGELFTPIGGGICRLNLAAFEESGLRAETVAGLFACAAKSGSGDLNKNLCVIEEMDAMGALGANCGGAREYIDDYRARSCPAVSHSEIFRREYAPAYRLVPLALAGRIRLFQAVDRALAEKGEARVAIDGMSASGKSTLGECLKIVYDANLFHMDDYFLPFEKKTPQRLAEPGGNVDYERFAAEIACRGCGEAFEYRPYSCKTGALAPAVKVEPNPVFIVEGAYSLHPSIRDGYDVKAFFEIDPEKQSARILERNGPEMHRRFMEQWIPMENEYISRCGVKDVCRIFLSADDEAELLKNIM